MHIFLVWACVLGAFGNNAFAQEVLTIGVENKDWYSHYIWQGNTLVGLDPDLVRTVAGQMGYEVVFEPYPWGRVIRMAEDKALDGVLDLALVQEREKYLHYVRTPITTEQTTFWVKKGKKVPFAGKFRPDLRLGLIRGADWTDRFAKMGTPTVKRFNTFELAFQNLVAGRIDIFASYLAPTLYHARRLGYLDRIESHAYTQPDMPYYLAFSDKPGHAELARKFNEKLQEFLSSPDYQTLKGKYDF
ncbi:transporter substrate-binding domain-containing protein [uncultured Pseudodesulfovibrio sp.]|uniref:substrate-binding periplasmic protein n=1 Tax=uncultured Pseudodesulfovibrio sp. TaxID=2035858 RepID=UPI0029C751B0|nr:transporter substrate-binding domain-containing protein [uncultured Pseudodesulfovibrio sp.]